MARQQCVQGSLDVVSIQFFPEVVGDVRALSQEAEQWTGTVVTDDLDEVVQLVTVEPTTGCNDNGITATGFQLMCQQGQATGHRSLP